MSSKVQLAAQTSDALYGSQTRRTETVEAPAPAKQKDPEPTSQADMRLIIEEAGEAGRYVYTVVDRRTGQVVSQLPREEVLKLREQQGYAAGSVFNGKA